MDLKKKKKMFLAMYVMSKNMGIQNMVSYLI